MPEKKIHDYHVKNEYPWIGLSLLPSIPRAMKVLKLIHTDSGTLSRNPACQDDEEPHNQIIDMGMLITFFIS